MERQPHTSPRDRRLTPRYREVIYERLHADGPAELMRLFEWLGEPIGQAEAEKYVAACAIDRVRSGDADAPWDLKTEPVAFFRRGEIDFLAQRPFALRHRHCRALDEKADEAARLRAGQ